MQIQEYNIMHEWYALWTESLYNKEIVSQVIAFFQGLYTYCFHLGFEPRFLLQPQLGSKVI